jgi:hypothetical protein
VQHERFADCRHHLLGLERRFDRIAVEKEELGVCRHGGEPVVNDAMCGFYSLSSLG